MGAAPIRRGGGVPANGGAPIRRGGGVPANGGGPISSIPADGARGRATFSTIGPPAQPAGATRLEAWREGTGGMPELLVIGEAGETTITLPNTITFHPGEPYQLWLQARNSRGTSTPGPVQNWTAP